MKKYIRVLVCLLVAHLIFASCAQTKYRDSLSCADIASALESEILGEGKYKAYEEIDIKYMLDSDDFDSCQILYSISSDDIGEIGVLHAKNAEDADKLMEDTTEYIEDYREQKSDFVRNYMPDQFEKLDNARVKRFGNYVVYTILPTDTSEKIFESVKTLLSE